MKSSVFLAFWGLRQTLAETKMIHILCSLEKVTQSFERADNSELNGHTTDCTNSEENIYLNFNEGTLNFISLIFQKLIC